MTFDHDFGYSFIPFFFPPKKWGRKKGEWSSKNCDLKSCLSARSTILDQNKRLEIKLVKLKAFRVNQQKELIFISEPSSKKTQDIYFCPSLHKSFKRLCIKSSTVDFYRQFAPLCFLSMITIIYFSKCLFLCLSAQISIIFDSDQIISWSIFLIYN